MLSPSRELSLLTKLAGPVFLAQIAQISMALVDTVMAGAASAVDMAGVAVATAFWNPTILFCQGILMAITPLVAQALGAGEREGLGVFVRQGLWIGAGLSLLGMGVLYGVACYIPAYGGMEPELARLSSGYLKAIMWGVPGIMIYCVMRTFQEGHGRTRPAMLAGFAGLCLNIPLNYIFVFGKLGMPALGGIGCGVASAVVCWLMAAIMVLSVRRSAPRAIRWQPLIPAVALRLVRIGLPGAFALLVEVSSFALIALLIAPLGATVVAGHQVAMNVSSLLFMLPLSMGAATTIRIGTYLGEGDLPGARRVRRIGLVFAIVNSLVVATFIYFCRHYIAAMYINDAAVRALAASLMLYTALYQVPDCIQMLSMAGMRGYNDTRAIMYISFLSYWVISLPLGYILALTNLLCQAMGVTGFWVAIILGLGVASSLYLIRVRFLERLPLAAVRARIAR